MSIIQRIRERAAWFIFGAIALSLLAFILQDALTRRGSYFSGGNTVGKVNGESIDKSVFDATMNMYEQRGATREQVVPYVWDNMVTDAVFQQQYKKLGLEFNLKELSDLLFGDNPPDWLRQQFTDPKTGVYNSEAVRQQFAQLKQKANDPAIQEFYEGQLKPTIQQGLRSKYQAMITGAVYVPKWLAEKVNADNNTMANISFVSVPYASVSDSAVKVTDDDIAAYIKKHPKLYQVKENSRQISYISFDASASAADSANIRAELERLKNEFKTTADEKSFLVKNSTELPYYDGYIGKAQIKQKVNDSIFALSVGDVYGPYLDGANYVLAKKVGERIMGDSAKVRHILVATQQTDPQSGQSYLIRDDSTAKKRLD
ncbi:MAG TPA: SurA N-terminal domain-containing protein, partial [Chitinophagaceae bacterium]|nr:SurA N-terminal domain-containing protein [Chitinophagaceae bacterium]